MRAAFFAAVERDCRERFNAPLVARDRVREGKKRHEDVLTSNRGEHCRHLVTQTQIQRHQSHRLMVHRIARLHSNRGERGTPGENSVRWQIGLVL